MKFWKRQATLQIGSKRFGIHDEHQQHELWRLGKQSDAKQGTGERKLSHQPDREHADGRTSL